VNVVEPRGNTAGASLETITGPKISEAVAVPQSYGLQLMLMATSAPQPRLSQ